VGNEVVLDASPAERMAAALKARRRRARWTPPEIAAAALLASVVLEVAGLEVQGVGLQGGGFRSIVASWTAWASQNWLPVVVLIAALIAWHQLVTSRDAVEDADDDDQSLNTFESWDHAGRANALAVMAGIWGVLIVVASIAYLIDFLWGSRASNPDGFPSLFNTREDLAEAAWCVESAVMGLASVVLWRRAHGIWRDLAHGTEPAGDQALEPVAIEP